MDVAFALPGYTAELFPVTNAISTPGMCDGAVDLHRRPCCNARSP